MGSKVSIAEVSGGCRAGTLGMKTIGCLLVKLSLHLSRAVAH